MNEEELENAIKLADALSFYKNNICQESSKIILLLVNELRIAKVNAQSNWRYACGLMSEARNRIEIENNSYNCGEL